MNFANHLGYSDVDPFEVIRHVSPQTIEVRRMNAVRANPENNLGFAPGGFVGHCSRQDEQEWIITTDPEAPVIRLRLSKAKRKAEYWFDKWGGRYALAPEPQKFYDYNF